MVYDAVEALRKIPVRPRAEDPLPYRSLLLAARRLEGKNRWQAVELLRHWTDNKRFGADEGAWQEELAAWSRWFSQTFPHAPALPDPREERQAPSKYTLQEILSILDQNPGGDRASAARGRQVFDRAQCGKCHRFGKDGDGVGPDLTTVARRFKKDYILESILSPSKVISDQYRSTVLITKKGVQASGLVSAQGDSLTVLQSDGSKVTLKKDEVEQQFASLVSVMPERLLDPLTRQEIADLFAFLTSEPK